jgi:protein translocase SecG subunit
MGILEPVLWVVFVLGCILVSSVILLQDSKGGGLGEAFGGVGQAAFGVDNKGIAKFTAYVTVFIVLIAIFITKIRTDDSVIVEFAEPAQGLPAGVGAAADPADVPVDVPVEAPIDPVPLDITPPDDKDGN